MAFETLLFEVKDGVALITINRPKALNALSPQVVTELNCALDQVCGDDSVRAVVFTGTGEKAFVAGADISVMVNFNALEAKRFSLFGQGVFNRIGALPQPVIAAVNGFALGGGCELALACDFIYASETARFGQPEINLGIIPGFGGTQRLSRRVGLGWAKELCLTGAMLSAAEAAQIGLVNRVFPADKLMDEVMKTARGMAAKGRVALREIKTVIEQGYDFDLIKACAWESDRFAVCFASPDAKEGMGAFLEKRKPEFKGGY
jgi:enoyl-CoA hydratase